MFLTYHCLGICVIYMNDVLYKEDLSHSQSVSWFEEVGHSLIWWCHVRMALGVSPPPQCFFFSSYTPDKWREMCCFTGSAIVVGCTWSKLGKMPCSRAHQQGFQLVGSGTRTSDLLVTGPTVKPVRLPANLPTLYLSVTCVMMGQPRSC